MTPKTLADAIRYFASPDDCREYLMSRRWPNGVVCPTCGSKSVYFDKSRNGWECKTRHPKRKFTLKTGTIFEDSPLGFDKWLPVVWMIANCKNGVSSHEIARAIGVTQKTAWFMLQRIRLAMQDDGGGKLGGEVELDETFIGGKASNMHHGRRKAMGITKGRSIGGQSRCHEPFPASRPRQRVRVSATSMSSRSVSTCGRQTMPSDSPTC